MIGIIGAMQIEVDSLMSAMQEKRRVDVAGMQFVEGSIEEQSVVVVHSGIGKVNAAIATSVLVVLFGVHVIINIGVAGGICGKVRIGDIVLSSYCTQHDYQPDLTNGTKGVVDRVGHINIECDSDIASDIGLIVGSIGHTYHIGIISTGDRFVSDGNVAQSIVDNFGAIAVDMESGAIAQVCYLSKVKFVSMRTISDTGDSHAEYDFASNMIEMSNRSCDILCRYLGTIKSTTE